MSWLFEHERELDNYFVARFSSFDKKEIVNDLRAVYTSVECSPGQAVDARVRRLVQLFTNSHSEQYASDRRPHENFWPALYVASIAMAQLAPPVDFSDFVSLIRQGFPNKAPDLERRRAAILALAFGHLGLCKALLDNEEVPISQRAMRLFLLNSGICSFYCLIYDTIPGDRTALPSLTTRLREEHCGPVMEAAVRGKSDTVRSIFQQDSLPLDLQRKSAEVLCRSRHGSACKHPGFFITHLPACFDFIVKSPIGAAILRGEPAVLKELLLSLPDTYWQKSACKRSLRGSLRLALMQDNVAIFDVLLNTKRPAHAINVLPLISEYGNSAFLSRFLTMADGADLPNLIRDQFWSCMNKAILYNRGEFIQALFWEAEKHGVELGLLPLTCLFDVLNNCSSDCLRHYLLALEKSFLGIPRSLIEKARLTRFVAGWPEGEALLFGAGVLGEEPLSLTKMCLSTIRCSLRHPVTASVQQLPLPREKKQWLLLRFF